MAKITTLSKFGFKLDGSSEWALVDKKFIQTDEFKALRVGDLICLKTNKAGYIIGASCELPAPKHPHKMGEHKPDLVSISDVESQINSKAHDILKGQCLNMACSYAIAKGFNLEDKAHRQDMFRLANHLLEELEAADYYGW